ncbi:MAG: alpha/beta fold hydrolase [Alcanivoracaceae bacterium]|nr:alpha/beta fold hydrolase [Alcanivoracaceae bacterium]
MKTIILKTIRFITKSLETISGHLAGVWASKLFFSPRKKHTYSLNLANMKTDWVDFTSTFGYSERCKVYQAGTGPTVLLVHGWEGSAYSYSVLSEQLVNAGYRVILFDFPAHGQSSGKKTNLEELQRLIKQLSNQEQDVHAIIGHSFGAFATAYAIALDLNVKHFISISSPVNMDFIVDSLCETIGASQNTRQRLITKIEGILKAPYACASIEKNKLLSKVKGMIIHDQKDKVVPFHQAKQLSNIWPNATFVTTSGLGHSRILKDGAVIKKIIDYLN